MGLGCLQVFPEVLFYSLLYECPYAKQDSVKWMNINNYCHLRLANFSVLTCGIIS